MKLCERYIAYLQTMAKKLARRTIGFDAKYVDKKFIDFVTEPGDGIKRTVLERAVKKGTFKLPSTIQIEKNYLRLKDHPLRNFSARWIIFSDEEWKDKWKEEMIDTMLNTDFIHGLTYDAENAWQEEYPNGPHLCLSRIENKVAQKYEIPEKRRLKFERLQSDIDKKYAKKLAYYLLVRAVDSTKDKLIEKSQGITIAQRLQYEYVNLERIDFKRLPSCFAVLLLNEISKAVAYAIFEPQNVVDMIFHAAIDSYADYRKEKLLEMKAELNLKRGDDQQYCAGKLLSLLYNNEDLKDVYIECKRIWNIEHKEWVNEVKQPWKQGALIEYIYDEEFKMAENGSWTMFNYYDSKYSRKSHKYWRLLPQGDIDRIIPLFSCFEKVVKAPKPETSN